MAGTKHVMSRRLAWVIGVLTVAFVALAFGLATVASLSAEPRPAQAPASAQGAGFPSAADIETYRNTVERVFMTDRGGTMAGMAACVMCHTWQTRPQRFSLETPATDAGWTVEQSRRNFDVVTKLVNTANPETSRLLLKPLASQAGGLATYGRHVLDLARGSRVPGAPEVDSQPAGRSVRPGARADARFHVLPVVRPAGLRDPARRPYSVQQLPCGRSRRIRAPAAEWQVVERRGGQAGVPIDLPIDHPREPRAEPLHVEAASP